MRSKPEASKPSAARGTSAASNQRVIPAAIPGGT